VIRVSEMVLPGHPDKFCDQIADQVIVINKGRLLANGTAAQIKAAIGDFFGDWNHRDPGALGRLFTAGGDLDMATKGQDTLASGAWDSAGGGPGARGMIAAFAERQWRLGEKLSYSGIEAIDLGGGDAAVVARFADGTVQPMKEAKFHYHCASQAFVHVVIISAEAAQQP